MTDTRQKQVVQWGKSGLVEHSRAGGKRRTCLQVPGGPPAWKRISTLTHFGRKNRSDWQQPLLVSVQCRVHRGGCGKPPEKADYLSRS